MASVGDGIGWSRFGHADISDAPVVVVAAAGTDVMICGLDATRGVVAGACGAETDAGAAATHTGVGSIAAFGGRLCQVTAGSDAEESEVFFCFKLHGTTAPTTRTRTDAANNLNDKA
ncbi:MAG: hypothetical protein LLF97_10915 [Planctomycetaceae bacterium]|nr:hypothetical protein [Planctomycetaceae bacterium]